MNIYHTIRIDDLSSSADEAVVQSAALERWFRAELFAACGGHENVLSLEWGEGDILEIEVERIGPALLSSVEGVVLALEETVEEVLRRATGEDFDEDPYVAALTSGPSRGVRP